MSMHKSNSKQPRGRTNIPAAGPGAKPSKLENQRQIRNAGTNKATGGADHLHRGDRRDLNMPHSK